MWWKKNKGKVIAAAAIIIVLAAAFWYGGGAPGLQGWNIDKDGESTHVSEKMPSDNDKEGDETGKADSGIGKQDKDNAADEKTSDKPDIASGEGLESRPGGLEGGMSAQEKIEAAKALSGGSSTGVASGSKEYSEARGMKIDPSTGKDKYMTDPVPEGKPLPVEPQDAAISDKAYTCTISISCNTVLDHMDWLDPEKVELVPEDGWILPATEVTFYEGESVFNVLQRTCKQKKIHMEFENTPMYNSAYIEGINNLYEFDCGELSGWMYKVNEWFPNYGCSRYALKADDVICWVYTCDLGVDVGGFYSTGN